MFFVFSKLIMNKNENNDKVNGKVFLIIKSRPGFMGSLRDENGVETFRIFCRKWKWNENMEIEMEFYKIETKMDFWWKRKQKRNSIFWRNKRENGIFVSS
jgi:hypothetical protein